MITRVGASCAPTQATCARMDVVVMVGVSLPLRQGTLTGPLLRGQGAHDEVPPAPTARSRPRLRGRYRRWTRPRTP